MPIPNDRMKRVVFVSLSRAFTYTPSFRRHNNMRKTCRVKRTFVGMMPFEQKQVWV